MCIFQSTLPREERQYFDEPNETPAEFQSTLPREERHCLIVKTSLYSYFNPRSHERSDFRDIFCFNVSQGFQSTLPREERHSCFIQCILHINFNPRSHERSDYYYHSNFRLKINFNPRSHERSDAGLQHNSHKFHPFQSTLPREERPKSG